MQQLLVNYSLFTYSSLSEVYRVARTFVQTSAYKISTTAIDYLSPKQTIRPDSFKETLLVVVPKIQVALSLRCWKLRSIFTALMPVMEGIGYLNVLFILKKISTSSETPTLTVQERSDATIVLYQALTNDQYLDKFDLFILSKHDDNLTNAHRDLKKFISINDSATYASFQSKVQQIIKRGDELEVFEEAEKLNVMDISVLTVSASMKALALCLSENDVSNIGILLERWRTIETMNRSPFLQKLRRLCRDSRPGGTVVLYDLNNFAVLNRTNFACTAIAQHIFMGKLCHIAIVVASGEQEFHLSHVIPKSHTITPIRDPLTTPFSYALDIDISPLLPTTALTDPHRLKEVFLSAFKQFSEVPHPELPLATLKEHVKIPLLGHKSIHFKPINSVALPPKGSPLTCSSYVAIIFLKAIQEVNQSLKRLKDKEIPHPFGSYESLERLDILRLVYLWKRLGVIRASPIHPIIAKVISSSTFLPLSPSS